MQSLSTLSHTSIGLHITPSQGLAQRPARHTWPAGHVTPSHTPTQLPDTQRWFSGHVTPMHVFSTQMPASVQVRPATHPSSPEHRSTHEPRSHT